MVCEDLGINIPGAVKVICFSNQPAAAIFKPGLTTIDQPAFEMGKAAATALIKSFKNNNRSLADENLEIPSKLIVRKSTTGYII